MYGLYVQTYVDEKQVNSEEHSHVNICLENVRIRKPSLNKFMPVIILRKYQKTLLTIYLNSCYWLMKTYSQINKSFIRI